MQRTRLVARAALVLTCALTLLPAAAGSRIERELDLSPGGLFELDTDNGQVEIVGGAGSGARVVITSTRDDIEDLYDIEFEQSGDSVSVDVERKGRRGSSWFNWNPGGSLRFEIQVPERTDVSIDTAGGSITAENLVGSIELDTSGGSIQANRIEGELDADTSGGSITVRDVRGDVNTDTSGGSITVEEVYGNLVADTSGGTIRIRQVSGDVEADTSGGSIRVEEAGGEVNASTSGGSIEVSFLPGNDRGGSLETSGGGISVKLDPGAGLDLDASAEGGRVTSDVPVTLRGKASKSSMKGTIGSGGSPLKIRASGGKVRIESI